MELVGRHAEVDRIATLAALPRESALVVVGDPGLGKSTLLDTAAGRVPIPVVRVEVNASEAHWPLSGVTTLFAALNDPRAAAHAARLVSRSAPTGADSGDELAAAHDFLEGIRALGLPRTLLLIDDLDLMDVESQQLIAFLAGRLAGTSLRIVATVRGVCGEGPLSSLPSMTLSPLDPDQALTLARVVAPDEADDGVLTVLVHETGGNPKALSEQLAALGREQLIGSEPLTLPLRPTPTADAVATHVLSCADEDQVAVLGRMAFSPAVRMPSPAFDRDTVADLVDAGLIRVRGQFVEFRNPLVRAHLHWHMPSRDRRAAHAELAEQLATSDAKAALWHRTFVTDRVDTVALLDAARSYAVDGFPFAAVTLAERALQRGDRQEAEQLALLGVAEALLAGRFLTLAARYAAAIHPFPSLTRDARRLRLRYSVDYLSGSPVLADELLVPMPALPSEETDTLAGLLVMVATFRAEAWECDSARDLLDRADPLLLEASAHTRQIHAAAEQLVAAVGGTLPPDEELHDGLESETLLALSEPALLLLGHALSLSERYRSARRALAIVLGRASRTAPVWIEAARYLGIENEIRSGHVRQALRAIDVWEAGSSVAERLREPSRVIAIAWRHSVEGRPSEALATLDLVLAGRSSTRLWGATAKLHALRGKIALLSGDVDTALIALEAADAIGRDLRNPTLLRHVGDLVEASVRAGKLEDARRLTERFDADHRRRPSRWGTLVLARCRALVAEPAVAGRAYREALEVFEPSDSPVERARTLDVVAFLLGRAGALEDRDKIAAAAAAAYEAAGVRRPAPVTALASPAPAFASAARSMSTVPSPAGAALRGASSAPAPFERRDSDASAILTMLTPEERSVAQKVTEGYRNKEIASSLYMSQRTVELRLTQIYRKVGARSRSHLVALLT